MRLDPAFLVIATVLLVSAVMVVRTRNLIHAVLWLGVTLLATAALYAQLQAPFLAGVQVLTYVGGVVTLAIFGVMVTRRHEGLTAEAGTEHPERGFIFATALFVLLAVATWKSPLRLGATQPPATTAELARALLDEYLIAFEALSLLLLAAIIGATVLARRRDPTPGEAGARGAPGSAEGVAQ